MARSDSSPLVYWAHLSFDPFCCFCPNVYLAQQFDTVTACHCHPPKRHHVPQHSHGNTLRPCCVLACLGYVHSRADR